MEVQYDYPNTHDHFAIEDLLQYGDLSGFKKCREAFASFIHKNIMTSEELHHGTRYVDHMIMTNGVSGAIGDFCTAVLPRYKNVVVYAEASTYFIVLKKFKQLGLTVKSVPIEPDGMDIDNLREQIASCDLDPKETLHLVYTIPFMHNPTGYTMSVEKRDELNRLAISHNNSAYCGSKYEGNPLMLILADETYQFLSFDSEKSKEFKPMFHICDYALSLFSTSKIWAPALRGGCIVSFNKVMHWIRNDPLLDSGGGNCPLNQFTLTQLIKSGHLEKTRQFWQRTLQTNCDAFCTAIDTHLSDFIEYEKPEGGYFLWLKIKDQLVTAENLLKVATDESWDLRVKFLPGNRCCIDNSGDYRIRVSFSWYSSEWYDVAAQRLKKVFECAVRDTLPYVQVNGSKGRLGSLIVEELVNASDLNYPTAGPPDIFVDVTSPEGTMELVRNITGTFNIESWPALVIGTTGLNEEQVTELKSYAKTAPVALVPNFGKGIPLFEKFMQSVDHPELWTASLLDDHHDQKKDAPSGTAKRLVGAYSGEVEVTSKREGDTVGTHTLVLDSPTEQIVLKHVAKDRRIFAVGALDYCRWISKQPAGFYTDMSSEAEPEAEPKLTSKADETDEIVCSKYEGCGNDFIIISTSTYDPTKLSPEEVVSFVKKHCNRHSGIGADGMIFVDTHEVSPRKWHFYNCDGSRAGMCGNGIRCCGRYLYDIGVWTVPSENYSNSYSLENEEGKTMITVSRYGDITVHLPLPKNVETLHDGSWLIHVGVPHAVKFPKSFGVKVPPANPKFNNEYVGKYNMNTVQLTDHYNYDEYEGYLSIRTFERGVNTETMACGTGCCAVAYAMTKVMYEFGINTWYLTTKSGDIVSVKIGEEEFNMNGSTNFVFTTSISKV